MNLWRSLEVSWASFETLLVIGGRNLQPNWGQQDGDSDDLELEISSGDSDDLELKISSVAGTQGKTRLLIGFRLLLSEDQQIKRFFGKKS